MDPVCKECKRPNRDHKGHTPEYCAYVCNKAAGWRLLGAFAMERALGKCEHCRTSAYLECAHRDPKYPTLGRERLDEVAILCRECHWHYDRGTDWQKRTVTRTLANRKPASGDLLYRLDCARDALAAEVAPLRSFDERHPGQSIRDIDGLLGRFGYGPDGKRIPGYGGNGESPVKEPPFDE